MKPLVTFLLLWLISFSTVYAQKKKPIQSTKSVNEIQAKVIYEFTGRVENQDDSVFVAFLEIDAGSINQLESLVRSRPNQTNPEVFLVQEQAWDKKARKKIDEKPRKNKDSFLIPLGQFDVSTELKFLHFEDKEKNKVQIKYTW